MTVYLDVIWLLNVLVDTLLLWLTAIFLKRNFKPWRLLLGGAIGSLIVILSMTPFAALAGHPFTKIMFSVFMVLTTFGYKRFKYFWTGLFTLYFSTFLMGGVMIGLHYFLSFRLEWQSAVLVHSFQGFGDPISWLFVMVAFPLAWHFSKRRIESITIMNIQYDVLADVTVGINGLTLGLKGLVDSGNQLYDPISRTPVMIISIENLHGQLPEELLTLAGETMNDYESVGNLPMEWTKRMRLIPAQSLGKSHQLLCAFKPDSLRIKQQGEPIDVSDALVVFTSQKLSSDQKFDCIVHPKMAAMNVESPAS